EIEPRRRRRRIVASRTLRGPNRRAFSGQRGHPPVRRIDAQRGLPEAANAALRQECRAAGGKPLDLRVVSRFPFGKLLVGEVAPVAILFGTLQRNAAHVVARERTGKIGVAPRRARQAPTRRVCGGSGRGLRERGHRRRCDNTKSKQRWEDDGGRPFHSDPSRDRMAKYTPSVMIVYKTTSASGVRMGCRSIRLLQSVAVALSSLGFTS